MIKNTEAFYTRARQFQDKRAQLVSDYEKKLDSMKKYEGSKGYQEDLEKLQKAHREALTALQDEYRSSLRTILKGMDEALSRRKINAPTNDQLNLIHLLKMRDKVSQEELDRVAEMVKDNGIAMGIIQEVARSNGIMKNYESMCSEMSSSYAQKVINGISDGLEDWWKTGFSMTLRELEGSLRSIRLSTMELQWMREHSLRDRSLRIWLDVILSWLVWIRMG